MKIDQMHTIQQIQHHASIYDRLRLQKKHTATDAMAMKQHATAITLIVDSLNTEAEAIRQKMVRELGVYEIEPRT